MAGGRKTLPRLRRATISEQKSVYLKPGLPEDELLMAVWNAGSRPTQLFRTLLLQGLKRMVERGELPPQIGSDLGVQRRLDALGDLTLPVAVQTVYAEPQRMTPPVAPSLQPAPTLSPAAHPLSSASPQKDSQPRRTGLDASLM